jgi:very-short-patch-repair endonuclease
VRGVAALADVSSADLSPFDGKSAPPREIFHVRPARRAAGGKSFQTVEIFHEPRVVGRGQAAVADAAAAQRGLVHSQQLGLAGLKRGAIRRLVAQRWLHPVLPRVHAVGHPGLQPLARELAVALYLGHDLALSHLSAASMWGIVRGGSDVIEATVIGRDTACRSGLTTYRVSDLDVRDVRVLEGMPVTAPARTLIDCAARAGDGALERMLNEARVRGLVNDIELDAAIGRCPLRTGVANVRELRTAEHGPALTRSEAERRLRVLIDQGQLPQPSFNVRLHGYLVDALWRASRLVVEVDGYAVHGHRAAFERDRRRDQALAAAGYQVLRITWRQLDDEPLAVVARLAQALALARGAEQ